MEYYTKQRSIQPSFVSTANSVKQCFLFWSNYTRLSGRITAWRASLGRSCLPQTVVIEFVGNQLQLGIIYDSISCANVKNGAQFPTPVYTNFTPDGGSDGYNEGKISGAA